jgi:ABC-type sugar transport system permease subunit
LKDREQYLVIFIPSFLLFFTFTVGLAIFNLFISFTDWHSLVPSFNFVGVENYLSLPEMSGFVQTLINTGVLFGIGLPLTVLMSVLIGILMDASDPRISYFFRTVAIISMALGGAMVASFWSWMYHYQYGGINELLRAIGLGTLALDWMGNSKVVMFSVILMLAWKFCGYEGLVVFGGLQGVEASIIESARIEGANTRQIYWYILLPQIRGHIFTISILLAMYLLKSFQYIYPLTGGGPGWASTVFPVLVYRQMFEGTNFAGGAAAAAIMLVVVSLIIVPYRYLLTKSTLNKMLHRSLVEKVVIWTGIVVFTIFFLYPFWISVVGAFKTIPQMIDTLPFVPVLNPTLEAYEKAWNVLRNPFFVSFQLSLLATSISVFFGLIGGYALVKAKYRWAIVVLALVLFALHIPPSTLPALKVVQFLRLYNTIFGVGLALGSRLLPISTMLYRQFFAQIPEVLYEVAVIEGANHFQILGSIVIPLARIPAIIVTVLSFGTGWNVLMEPLVLTSGRAEFRPVAVALTLLKLQSSTKY